MDEEYGKAYAGLFRNHWWWRARRQRLLSLIAAVSPRGGWSAILDIGCGDGLFFDYLARFGAVEGVESDSTLIADGSPYRDRIHVGRFDWSFRPAKRYGLILMLDVLEHLPDPEGALQRAVSLLEPGGTLLVTVPAFNMLWTSHDDRNRHLTRYTKRVFRKLAAGTAMEIRSMHYWFQWLFLAKLAVRFKEWAIGRNGAGAQLPASWVNRFLYATLRSEAVIVDGLRMRMPFGTSLVIVGGQAQE